MADWHEILNEILQAGSTHDIVRRKYLDKLHQLTGRNIIIYYSSWLQKPDVRNTQVNDNDKNAFMTVVHKLDPQKGLDLILHTPGGEAAATESLVGYLHSVFGTDIRAIVPQLALSAGTMIACACKKIIMGEHSSLGPIDPQIQQKGQSMTAHGVVEEFKRAYKEISVDPKKIPMWQPIIANYEPALIGECEKAIEWANKMVQQWLIEGMLQDENNAQQKAEEIIKELSDHALTKSHARHLSLQKCKSIFGESNVIALEEDKNLQDAVLSVHHSCIHTLSSKGVCKITENHEGIAYIQTVQPVIMAQPMRP